MNDVAIQKTPQSAPAPAGATTPQRPTFRPRVDLLEREQEVLLLADMPGSRPEDIEIHFENGTLTVRGSVGERQAEATRYLMREYRLGDFQRSFTLGEQIDTENISAEFVQGVLTVHLPKLGRARARKITVRAG